MGKSKVPGGVSNESTHIIAAGAMAGTNPLPVNAANGNRLILDIRDVDAIGFIIKWTSTAVGSFKVEVSDDYRPSMNNLQVPVAGGLGTWADVTAQMSPTLTQPNNNATTTCNCMPHTAAGAQARYLAFSYVNASGSGVLDVWAHGKALGG